MLVADADDANREATVFALTMAGIRVLQATDAASTAALLRFDIDAALVDAHIAAELEPTSTPMVIMHDEESLAGGDVTALYKPARSVEMIAALAAADGLGGRPCVLVSRKQQQWASRLARHGAVVAVSSPVAFSHAIALLRPGFAVAPPELEEQAGALCRLLDAEEVA